MMYRFNWEQISTESIIAKCKPFIANEKIDAIKSNIAFILRSTGGLSIANSKWTKPHQENVSEKLFHEALRHYLSHKYRFSSHSIGYFIDGNNQLQKMDRADPNRASIKTLDKLPVLGPALSNKIVEDRKVRGNYTNNDDLQDRIHGLGDEGMTKLNGIIQIDNDSLGQLSDSLDTNLKSAYELYCLGSEDKSLVSFLEDMATFSSMNPHPASKMHIQRPDLETSNADLNIELKPVSKATIITDENYYPFISESIKAAQSSIEICMFFLSFGGETHPNRKLLDALIEKHKSGISVKVVLDVDRQTDPYGSRIINSEAADYLKKEGIDVRFDKTDRLLHSKFVIVDNERVIVGSHNWTKGSFFEYKDISLCLEGASLVSDFKARFEAIFKQ